MQSTKSKIQESVMVFKDLIEKGGPQKEDYPLLNTTINELGIQLKNGIITKDDLVEIYDLYEEDFMQHTMQGHALKKPYGYPGDFMMIDMTYQYSTYPKYKLWEDYAHQQIAVQAVRNRKDYFLKTLGVKCANHNQVSLLNVASGPARDLLELYQGLEAVNLTTFCIEYDPKAIEYAAKLTEPFQQYIQYEQANIYKYDCEQQFDVIWSAGLFDYFDDATFIKILKKMLTWTNKGYEIILGNLQANPSRYYLEILGEWYLHYRTEADLIRLAKAAGILENQISIGREDAGVNLFLHIKQ